MPPFTNMELRPIERGEVLHRQLQGLPPKYHCRLKHQGRTFAILQGDSEDEAEQRALRLAEALFRNGEHITIEQA